jgi:hypothetical protein
VLEKELGTSEPEATARKLEVLYPAAGDLATWKPAESEQIAWESHQLAESDVYQALGIPERPCSLHSCDAMTSTPVTLSSAYMDREGQVAPTREGGAPAGGATHPHLAAEERRALRGIFGVYETQH